MDRKSLLAKIPMFESLPPEDLALLESRLEEKSLPADTAVFTQGEPGDSLFVIQEGSVEVALEQGKRKLVLANLHEGQYFGEISLLDGGVRSATVRTLKPTLLLALDRQDFGEFLTSKPRAALSILAEMGERMRQTNELMSRQVSKNVLEEAEEKLTFGQRVADKVAAFGGSWGFIGVFGGIMLFWMVLNAFDRISWDVYPFILLNLCLSTIAALQARSS
jgi:CRP-like cAMP-binding protein